MSEEFNIRDANESDLNSIFMMGFDVWSGGVSEEEYLKACHESSKYKKGQFKVLENSNELLSSLICYELAEKIYGIGSIATPLKIRKQGWGSKITLMVAELLEIEKNARAIFLYADINPEFYEKLGFVKLPNTFQEYATSTCMVRDSSAEKLWSRVGFHPPKYF